MALRGQPGLRVPGPGGLGVAHRVHSEDLVPHATAPDGTRIAYQVQGRGAPLVLLAGQASSTTGGTPSVAQWVAARYPGHVGRLIMGCTSPAAGGTDQVD